MIMNLDEFLKNTFNVLSIAKGGQLFFQNPLA